MELLERRFARIALTLAALVLAMAADSKWT